MNACYERDRAEDQKRQTLYDRHMRVLNKLIPLSGERIAADRRYRDVHDLYDTFCGHQTGQTKQNFEIYVQQYYFRQVVAAANVRLRFLTNDMFCLRCQEQASSLVGQSGLGLEVLDSNTGCWREVSSLSGGESFLASLALALVICVPPTQTLNGATSCAIILSGRNIVAISANMYFFIVFIFQFLLTLEFRCV